MAHKSKYAEKRESGRMMYGPGCCAHKVTNAQVSASIERARKRGHFDPPKPKAASIFEYTDY